MAEGRLLSIGYTVGYWGLFFSDKETFEEVGTL